LQLLRMRLANAVKVASAPCRARARGLSRRRAAGAATSASWSWPASDGDDDEDSSGGGGARSAAAGDDAGEALLPRDVVDLSLVLLVHENLRRRLGQGILPIAPPPSAGDRSAAGAAGGGGGGAAAAAAAAAPAVDVPSALGAAEALPAALFLFSAEGEDGELLYANGAARAMLAAAVAAGPAAAAAHPSAAAAAAAAATPPPLPALSQRLPRVAEDAPCAVLPGLRWDLAPGLEAATFSRALACPVVAPSGEPVGRALLAGAWAWADSAPRAGREQGDGPGASPAYLGRPGWPRVAPADLPSSASARAAAEAVTAQAGSVRALKAAAAAAAAARGDGGDDDPFRTRGSPANRDSAVLAAVAELGRLKARLAEAEAMRAAFFGGDGDCGEEEEEEGEEGEQGGKSGAAAAAGAGGGELMRGLLRLADAAEADGIRC